MLQLIYFSDFAHALAFEEVKSLIDQSVNNNKKQGITGVLATVDSSFIQVLEGEPDAVNKIFEKIAVDSRHNNIRVVYRDKKNGRDFSHWWMGFSPCIYADELLDANKLLAQYLNRETLSERQSESLVTMLSSLVRESDGLTA